jgi:hypothetical protein
MDDDMSKTTPLLWADERDEYLQTVERELNQFERREHEFRSNEKRERLEVIEKKLQQAFETRQPAES